MGKLQNFAVALDNQTGVFYAGQVVSGNIQVDLMEPMKMRRIHLTILGSAKVHWSTGDSNDRRHYRSEEVYFNDRVTVVGSAEGELTLPVGSHRYLFNVNLPHNLPSSFEGQHGYVRYLAEATIDKPWKFDHQTRTAFTVICILDLNAEPFSLREPCSSVKEEDVSCLCCVSGVVSAQVSVNKRCFVPGETVYISAQITNNSNSNIDKTWATLKQHIEFRAPSDSFFSSGEYKSKWVSVETATVDQAEVIAGGSTGQWTNVPLVIPSTAPSRLQGCSIINVNYALKFYTDNGLKIPIDIVIGTVPLREALPVIISQPVPQPTAPSVEGSPFDASASDLPPPLYEECVQGRVTIREEGDSDYIRGDSTWAPKYPMYRQLSFPSGAPS